MAEYTRDQINQQKQFGGVPYGNSTTLEFKMTTDSSGIVENTDATAALGSGDTVLLGILPVGAKLLNCLSIVSNAFTAASTCKLGFKYVDGVDDSDVPQDDDYFHAALALNAAGRTVANNTAVAPVVLPKAAYLFITHSAHTQAEAGRVDFLVDVLLQGAP